MSTRIVNIQGGLEQWGLIPAFLSIHSDVPLWEQIHLNYQHGGGWIDMEGFKYLKDGDKCTLYYPGDPIFNEIGRIAMTNPDEMLVLFDYQIVLWVKGDEHKIARID